MLGAVVGAVLVAAAVSKLARPGWAEQAPSLGVPVAVARPVPWVEIVFGAALVSGVAHPVAAWGAAVLCAGFVGVVGRQLAHGHRPVCACFGQWSRRPIGVWTLVRNLALTAAAVMAAVL